MVIVCLLMPAILPHPIGAIVGGMKYLRVIDPNGNKQDYEAEFVPRIGERIVLEYGIGSQPVTTHFFRVKDVEYHLQNPVDVQARILLEEDSNDEQLVHIGLSKPRLQLCF
jgi:hypothetical protein